MDSAKKIGGIIAVNLPPPGKMKRMSDSGGGDPDGDEAEDAQDGRTRLADMWDALKAGDKDTAWTAFCDAMDKAREEAESPEGDEGPSRDRGDY